MELTRSEEELRVTTRRRATRTARLRRRLETRQETVTRTVPLRRERVEIEFGPPPPAATSPSPAGPDAEPSRPAAGEGWLVLYEEEVVISTRWVARERVRLAVHEVTAEREVAAEVRSERVHLTGGPDAGSADDRTS